MEQQIFAGNEDSLEPIRKYIAEAARAAGLSNCAVYNLCLAVDEIATNIVQHGYKEAGLTGNIRIGASLEDQKLVIRMEDQGQSYDPTRHEIPSGENLTEPLATRSIGGLGILLARKGVDDLQYTSTGGTNVHRFIVALDKCQQGNGNGRSRT